MEIDEGKIQEKITELNKATQKEWVAIDGYHAITTAHLDDNGGISFNPASGIIIKTFVEIATGEMKFYPIVIFQRN